MVAFDMNLNGLRKTIQSMQEMAGHAAIDMVNELAGIGEAQAKALAPVAPVNGGELRESIHMTPAKIEGGEVVGSFGTNSDHAVFVEYGTGQRGLSGEIANEQEKDPSPDISYREDWAGMAAQPYMYPASKLVSELMPEILEKHGKRIAGGR